MFFGIGWFLVTVMTGLIIFAVINKGVNKAEKHERRIQIMREEGLTRLEYEAEYEQKNPVLWIAVFFIFLFLLAGL